MGLLSNALPNRTKTDGRPPTLVQVVLPPVEPTWVVTDWTGAEVATGLSHIEALRMQDHLHRTTRQSHAIHSA